MERRSFLKMLLASPLLGLLKKKEELKVADLLECKKSLPSNEEYSLTADDIRAAMKDIPNFETIDTSGGPVAYYDGTWFYAKRMVKVHQNLMDETIIKAMS